MNKSVRVFVKVNLYNIHIIYGQKDRYICVDDMKLKLQDDAVDRKLDDRNKFLYFTYYTKIVETNCLRVDARPLSYMVIVGYILFFTAGSRTYRVNHDPKKFARSITTGIIGSHRICMRCTLVIHCR